MIRDKSTQLIGSSKFFEEDHGPITNLIALLSTCQVCPEALHQTLRSVGGLVSRLGYPGWSHVGRGNPVKL